MLSIIKSKRFLMSLLFAVFSFCVAIMYNFIPLVGFDMEAINYLMKTTGDEIIPLLISSGFFVAVITFLCYNIGDFFKKELNLNAHKMDKKSLFYILGVGLIVPVLIGLIDSVIGLGESFVSFSYSLLNVSTSILYYGVIEEIWLRFAFLPLIVYAFYKVFNREKKEENINKKYYILGLVFTSLFLFVFEFNKIISMYSLNLLVLIRAILVYLIPNYVYGHLYLKYNIKASVLAHSIFMIMHIGVMPFVLTLM